MRGFTGVVIFITLYGCITENNPGRETEDGGGGGAAGEDGSAGRGGVGGDIDECEFRLEASPNAVDFGRVAAFEMSDFTVELRNTGTCDLVIEQVLLNGSAAFGMAIDGVDPRRQPEVLAVPIAVGAARSLVVRFNGPADGGPNRGELLIFSPAGQLTLPLSATGGPCLLATPNALEFRALPGEEDVRRLTVTHCGTEPVTVVSSALLETDDPVFERVAEQSAPLPFEVLPEGPELTLAVSFRAERPGTYEGAFVLETDDPENPTITVRLLGRASANQCPVASVGPVDEIRPDERGVVLLNGSDARDPDGPDGLPTRWTWVVVSRPEGSTSVPVEGFQDEAAPAMGGPADDDTTPNALFFADLPGTYILELRVGDGDCEATSRLVIQAGAERAIQIQLTWAGVADLDLRVHHPLGAFDGGPLECSAANPTPDWEPLEDLAGDPQLDRDDRGNGPENVIIDLPEPTAAGYGVGVALDGVGVARATIRVFINGEVRWEESADLDPAVSAFWEAARITWPDGGVRPYNP